MLPGLGGRHGHAEPDTVAFFNIVDFWQFRVCGYVLTNVELGIGIQYGNAFIL